MDPLNDMIEMNKTFDDLLFSNWNHQTFGEVVQSPSRTNSNADTDSDSGIGYSSSSNSPMANTYQHHQQNEHIINTTLTDNTVDSELSQFNDLLLYNQIDNEPLSYQPDFDIDLNADELLENIEHYFESQIGQRQSVEEKQDDVILIEDEDIKIEPVDLGVDMKANKILGIIDTLKECQQSVNATTTVDKRDVQLMQLLNTRPMKSTSSVPLMSQVDKPEPNQPIILTSNSARIVSIRAFNAKPQQTAQQPVIVPVIMPVVEPCRKKIKIEPIDSNKQLKKPLAPKTSTIQQASANNNNNINPVNIIVSTPHTAQVQQKPITVQPLTVLQQLQQQQNPLSPIGDNIVSTNTGDSLSKKQFRMMKNRESACLSRKRKKEYMQTLEEKLQEIFLDNQKLVAENNSLKEKVRLLTSENDALKSNQNVHKFELTPRTNTLKRPLVMFAILFVMGLNVFHFADLNSTKNPNDLIISENQRFKYDFMAVEPKRSDGDTSLSLHIGRTLLSDYDYEQPSEQVDQQQAHKPLSDANKLNLSLSNFNGSLELIKLNDTWHFTDPNICTKILYFNETHAIKINTELYDWYERLNKVNGPLSSENGVGDKVIETKLNANRYKLKGTIYENRKQKKNLKTYELSVYNDHAKLYNDFVRSIRQKNDTFYIMSFRRDHIMFPPLYHNKTQRPRISLIMPALININNETNKKNSDGSSSIVFMKIDCEILDTTLLTLNSNKIPANYMKILLDDYDQMKSSTAPSDGSTTKTITPTSINN